jgi:Tol biopolymer transport system component/serine/threonine protein kinase
MPDGEERIGTRLGAYRIERLIGRGGMGMVFLAEHVHLGRMVALKILPPDLARDESFRKRFVRESRLAAGIEHPNVIPVYDAGESEGDLFIAMKYVEGTDLRALLQQRGRLDPERMLVLLEPVGTALDAAHREGLVHRDVKPGNILIAATDHVYLSDFGLTKRTSADTSVTATGYFVGTMSYAPPEQIQAHDLDGRADQYSLACLAFECLTGRVPFVRDTDVALLYAHLQEPPPTASEYGPELPPAVDEVLARGMAKSRDDRYASCSALVEGLRGAIRGTALPPPEAPAAEPATMGGIRTTRPPQASTVRGPTVRAGEPTIPSPERPPPAPPEPEGRSRRGVRLFVLLGTALIGALAAFLVLGPLSQPEEEGQMPASEDADGGNGREEQIVFLRPGPGSLLDVWVMAADGSGQRRLHTDIASGTAPSWSPDRQHVVFDGEGDGDGEIYVMRAQKGGQLKKLTDNTVEDLAPAWSPDGTTIAFASDEDGPDFDIWVMNPDGTGQRKLFEADGDQTHPAWSPDGSRLAFEDDRSGSPDIWVVDAAGTTDPDPLLVEPGDEGAPAWSPDGNSIAFRSNREGNLEIYVMTSDGDDVERLTETEADERAPSWSADGSKILFHSNRDGDMDLWVMNPNGTDQVRISRTTGDEFGASF